jgi:integrase
VTDTFLSYEEIQALTHRKVHSAQVRVLKAMGIEHRVRPDGSVAILRAAVAMAKQARSFPSMFLFCNREGQCYINEETGKAPGWKSMWQRYMDRVIKETKVENHFTEHDLRAKVASDAGTLEHARSLLAHADSRTTDRIYRRKAEVVKPLR